MNTSRKKAGKEIAIILMCIWGALMIMNINQCSQTEVLKDIKIEMQKMRLKVGDEMEKMRLLTSEQL